MRSKLTILFLVLMATAAIFACPSCCLAQADDQPEDFTVNSPAKPIAYDSTATTAISADAPFWDKKVRKIIYTVPPYMKDAEVRKATKIKVNKPLSKWRVRQTIRKIYLMGTVEYPVIKAIMRPDDTVDVEIKINPKYQIRDIIVKGNKEYNYSEITLDILHLSTGDDYKSTDKKLWKRRLRTAYSKMGYFNARFDIETESTKWKDDNKTDVFITISEGKAFKVKEITLKGDLGPYSRNQILRKLKWREGMKYEEEKFVRGIARLKKFLKKNDHLEAYITDWDIRDRRVAKIDRKNSKMIATIEVNVGPKVLIEFNKECFTCMQQKWKIPSELNITNQRRFNKYIVKDWEEKIEEYFKKRGYYDVVVVGTYEEGKDETGPVKHISFVGERGKRVKIREIDFKNNPSFKDKELIKLLTSDKYFTESEFDTDLENIINFYNTHGFLKAKVLEKRMEYIKGEGINIMVVLQEGPKTILKSIDIPDTKVFPREKFDKLFEEMNEDLKKNDVKFRAGEPLNPFLVENAKSLIIAEYMREGYIKSRVKTKVTPSKDNKEATVSFYIKEGKRYKFGAVYIRGNKLTKKYVIRRELFVTEGEPFNYENLFDSEQALVALGFFRTVQIRPIDLDEESEQVDLLVEVEERNAGYIETGLGYNTYFGYSAGFEVGHKNLAGHGRRLSFHADASMKDERFLVDNRHVAVDFMWPWIARTPMDGKITIFDNLDEDIGFELRSFGTVLGVSTYLPKLFYNLKATRGNRELQRLWKFWTVALEYEFARDFIFNIDEDVEEEPGEIQITVLKPIVTRDERNNPFHPTRGIKATLGTFNQGSLSWAAPALQSEVHYLQAEVQSAVYWGMFDIPKTGVFVLAQNFRVGHGQVLRETDEIPLSRRFYLGGSTTIRGFKSNEIAPLADDGRTPIGGNFLVQSNSELRIPLPKSLGLLLFFDLGDVTKDTQNFYIDLMRATSGLGFRYMTPVGPISLDYGLKLNKRHYETLGEFYITIGNAF